MRANSSVRHVDPAPIPPAVFIEPVYLDGLSYQETAMPHGHEVEGEEGAADVA
jgi:hypothetical protein